MIREPIGPAGEVLEDRLVVESEERVALQPARRENAAAPAAFSKGK
jgi:hypothetical protein